MLGMLLAASIAGQAGASAHDMTHDHDICFMVFHDIYFISSFRLSFDDNMHLSSPCMGGHAATRTSEMPHAASCC